MPQRRQKGEIMKFCMVFSAKNDWIDILNQTRNFKIHVSEVTFTTWRSKENLHEPFESYVFRCRASFISYLDLRFSNKAVVLRHSQFEGPMLWIG